MDAEIDVVDSIFPAPIPRTGVHQNDTRGAEGRGVGERLMHVGDVRAGRESLPLRIDDGDDMAGSPQHQIGSQVQRRLRRFHRIVNRHRRLNIDANIAAGKRPLKSAGHIALERAFENWAFSVLRERMQSVLYSFLARTDISVRGEILVPEVLPEPRLERPGSGLYASIYSENLRWESPSAMERELPFVDGLKPGEISFKGIPEPVEAFCVTGTAGV